MSEDQNTTLEEFRKIEGFPNYSVSNLGRVRSDAHGGRFLYGLSVAGRPVVNLFRNGKQRTFFIHRLVCCAFIGEPCRQRPYVNHKNGNKTDNRATNLEWVSQAENNSHAGKTGLMPRGEKHWQARKPELRQRGEACSTAKLTEESVRSIRILHKEGLNNRIIADKFGVRPEAIWKIVHGVRWSHVV